MIAVKIGETYEYSKKGMVASHAPRKVKVIDAPKGDRVRVLFISTGKQQMVSKANLQPVFEEPRGVTIVFEPSDENNPDMAFQGLSTKLLKAFVSGKLDALDYMRKTLEERGVKL